MKNFWNILFVVVVTMDIVLLIGGVYLLFLEHLFSQTVIVPGWALIAGMLISNFILFVVTVIHDLRRDKGSYSQ